MINGYTIANVRELYGIDQYQCFVIGAIDYFGEDMTVKKLIDLAKHKHIGCLATTHKAITLCVKGGFVLSTPTYSDRRIKVLTNTPKAKMYLSDLNKGVRK